MSLRDLTDHLDDETLRRIVDVQAARLQSMQRELAKAKHDRDRYKARIGDTIEPLLELRNAAGDLYAELNRVRVLQPAVLTQMHRMAKLIWATQ